MIIFMRKIIFSLIKNHEFGITTAIENVYGDSCWFQV